MVDESLSSITGQVIDDEHTLSLGDLCRCCGVHADVIVTLVEEGIIEPRGETSGRWSFSAGSLRRAMVAMRLHRDLGVNFEGVALAIELLERIEALEARLRARGR